MIKYSVLFAFLSGLLLQSCRVIKPANMEKNEFQLDKYLGKWYEIARFPHNFEKDLQGVTATYTMMDNGKVRVLNQGYRGSLDGKISSAKGKAYLVSSAHPPKLKVSFFLFFYADYNILALDYENYQWAMVGSSSPKYLWILSRKPELDSQILEMLKNKARELGYNLDKLQMVAQRGEEI